MRSVCLVREAIAAASPLADAVVAIQGLGATALLLGGALAVKPLLGIKDGVITTLEKVRTSGRAISTPVEIVTIDRTASRSIRRVMNTASEDVRPAGSTDRAESATAHPVAQ